MLPVGKYVAKAVQAELGFAETGTELVAVLFELTEGEFRGTRITWRGYFTDRTSKRAIESLKFTGWKGSWETWEGLGSLHVQLDVQEDRDMKSGEVRGTRVAWVNPSGLMMRNGMDPAQRKAFAGRMTGLVTEVMSTPITPIGSRSPLPFKPMNAEIPMARGERMDRPRAARPVARTHGNNALALESEDMDPADIPF